MPNETKDTGPNGGNKLGYNARLARKPKGCAASIIGGAMEGGPKTWGGSVRLQLWGECEARFIVFSRGGKRVVDENLKFSQTEFRAMFGLDGKTVNDPEFARENNAEWGIPGKFVRTEGRLVVLCTDKKGLTHEMSIYVTPSIRKHAENGIE
ncbi:MAG TPA: hypothetical protein VFT82_03590 [Candidatus Paceibacterota bacterium]|nr:hypothetical protein [Candidatus Paceibacterota bacterium]